MTEDDDNPEWTKEDFVQARPFEEVFPAQHHAWKNPGGRPKVHVGFRLAADVVEGIKVTGKGYNARVEQVLRDALAEGKL